MPVWLILTIAALFVWGAWGVFFNLTSRYLGATNALIWEVVGAAMVGAVVLMLLVRDRQVDFDPKGVSFGMLTGVTYTIGLLLAFLALRSAIDTEGAASGRIHTVLIVTALYPMIASIFNFAFLSEPLSQRQLFGMVLGLVAITIFVTD